MIEGRPAAARTLWFLPPPPRLVEEIGLGAHREKENEGVGWKMEKNGGIFSVV
jgi:hypothetical protein